MLKKATKYMPENFIHQQFRHFLWGKIEMKTEQNKTNRVKKTWSIIRRVGLPLSPSLRIRPRQGLLLLIADFCCYNTSYSENILF